MPMRRSAVAEPGGLRRLGMMLVIAMLELGCAAQGPDAGAVSGAVGDPRAADLPTGAVPVGEELYQVPTGVDEDGCPMFRLYSPTRLVAQVIYYRDAAGGFTMSKQDAVCDSRLPD